MSSSVSTFEFEHFMPASWMNFALEISIIPPLYSQKIAFVSFGEESYFGVKIFEHSDYMSLRSWLAVR